MTPGQAPKRQQTMVHTSRTYVLGRTPDQGREQAFQELLDLAYNGAVKNHSGDNPMEIGFSYSLTPKGAVYPFSEVEVACLMKRADSGYGKALCADFFGAIDSKFGDIVKGQ